MWPASALWCQEALAFEEYKRRLASVHGISAATAVKISAEFPSAAALCQAESSKVAFRIQQSLTLNPLSLARNVSVWSAYQSTIYKIEQKLMKYDEVGAWSSAMYLELEHFSGFLGSEKFFLYALRMSRQNTLYPRRFVPPEISFSRGGQVVSQRLHLWCPSSQLTPCTFNLTQQCCGMSTLLWCSTVALGDKYIGGSPTKFNTTNEGQFSSAWLWWIFPAGFDQKRRSRSSFSRSADDKDLIASSVEFGLWVYGWQRSQLGKAYERHLKGKVLEIDSASRLDWDPYTWSWLRLTGDTNAHPQQVWKTSCSGGIERT